MLVSVHRSQSLLYVYLEKHYLLSTRYVTKNILLSNLIIVSLMTLGIVRVYRAHTCNEMGWEMATK